MKTMKWVTFYSRSGSEIVELSKHFGYWPDVIITNKAPHDTRSEFTANTKVFWLPMKPSAADFIELSKSLKEHLDAPVDQILITLHGFLRIVPPEFIDVFPNILNGHPGLIDPALTDDPDFLKGKDPQKKAFEEELEYSGAVIHEVTPIVDDGEILISKKVLIEGLSLDEIYSVLARTSLNLWKQLIPSYLNK